MPYTLGASSPSYQHIVHPRLKSRAYYVKPASEAVLKGTGYKVDRSGGVYLAWQAHGGTAQAAAVARKLAGWAASETPAGVPEGGLPEGDLAEAVAAA